MPESSFDETADQIADLLVRVYEIHEIVIAETGGLSGLREPGLLHAAVARPFATFQGRELYPLDFEKAAALFHSLIKSHPFMDGTKRTAFAAALFSRQMRARVTETLSGQSSGRFLRLDPGRESARISGSRH